MIKVLKVSQIRANKREISTNKINKNYKEIIYESIKPG